MQGLYFPQFTAADANPDIGDSTVTETAGYGGMAMAAAPAITKFVGGTPQTGDCRPRWRCTRSPSTSTSSSPSRRSTSAARRCGIDVRKVMETGILPQINTGIAHKDPGVGMVGAGILRAPSVLPGCVRGC